VPLTAGKTVAYVTLPSDSNMHIFATGFGTRQPTTSPIVTMPLPA
jgi:hypothetical protein